MKSPLDAIRQFDDAMDPGPSGWVTVSGPQDRGPDSIDVNSNPGHGADEGDCGMAGIGWVL